jgi:hypothetical protein
MKEHSMSTTTGIVVPTDAPREVPPELLRARLLGRRLNGALWDLGLVEKVPTSWVTPACSGWYFSPFTHHQANKLVVALEDLAVFLQEAGLEDHLRAGAFPGPGQQAFDFGGGA